MNRRHFVYLSGTALASLMFVRKTRAASNSFDVVHLPEKVFVRLDDGLHELIPSGQEAWSYRDVSVFFRHSDDTLSVKAGSPKNSLHQVVLQWSYPVNSSAVVLGDHWERTYGDVFFQPPSFERKMPWYFIQHDGEGTACFGVKTGCHAICYWQLGAGTMQLTMDTHSGGVGVELGDRVLDCAEVIATKASGDENTFATARRFCGMMCKAPRLPRAPVYGINDWYFAYGNNSSDLILQHTSMLADVAADNDNRPFSVIDAGWASYSPLLPGDCCWQDDFSRPNDKFKDMQKLANDIRKLGMRPGLWTRPLCAPHDAPQKLLLPAIRGRDNPKNPVLDPTIDENIAHVQRNISIYDRWGYEMVKHDFTTFDIAGKWGFEMNNEFTEAGWSFHDRTKTTAEVILHLYQSIREAAGEMYLIGCNTMSHLSAGIFELNRIGDDTSGKDWERTRKMGVNTLGFRMIQHNHFYAADGDCVGLTRDVPWAKNQQWMRLLAESSAPLFISAQPDALGEEQKQFIKYCFSAAANPMPVAEPLDWLTNQWPEKWRLNGSVRTFDWS
jgi:alpha-galactosidase